jgi:hypothetical protein
MNKEQRKHYDQVARFGCSLCHFVLGYQGTPCEIHHIRRAGKRDTAPVIGLCPSHHRGNDGIHGMGRRAFEKLYGITEEELLEKTLELIDAYKEQQSISTHMRQLQAKEKQ